MARRTKLNSRGMRKMLTDPKQMDPILKPVAEAGASRAKASAPRDTGAYAESIHTWTDETDRRVWRYGSSLSYAMVIEARTGNLARSL